MGTFVGEFILLYLLLPILGILVCVLTYFIAKKNELLGNKKVIFYFILTSILLALPGLLGFIDYWFMPYAYLSLLLLYFILGHYNLKLLRKQIKDIDDKPYYLEFLLVFVIMFLGGALFSLIFNLCNELEYGLWACTCILTFIFPSIFMKTYKSFLEIPLDIYKIWYYDEQIADVTENDFIDSNKIAVVEMELFKKVADTEPLNIKAKAAEDMNFGVWFKIFINDYNKKSAASPIIHSEEAESYGWIFYTITPFLGRKKYIDPDLSFSKNRIKENWVIIAKRTQSKDKEELAQD